jgi:glycosyltransferase involved in cell wall biosynthesis
MHRHASSRYLSKVNANSNDSQTQAQTPFHGVSNRMNPARVLHVLGTAEPAGMAIFRIVETLAVAVDPGRYEIQACFLRPGELVERLQHLGVKAICVNWSGSVRDLNLRGVARYATLLRSSEFSIIHQHVGGRLLTGMGRLLTHAQLVLNLHARTGEQGIVSPKPLLPPRDALIVNSQAVADYSNDPTAVVIYPGINVSDFSIGRPEHTGIVVGTACRLEIIKGLDCLIEALSFLAPEFPEMRLEIAGNGSLRADLERRSRKLGLAGIVSFLGWREDLPSVMAGWDIFVLASLDEGFGVAVLEAMAAGLPVVASEVGGLCELVRNGETGWLVPPSAPAELAQRVRELIHDSRMREKMGSAARQRALQEFSISRMVEQTIAVYDKLIG